MTNAWVYLFSKFSSELLIFEALAILALTAGYAAFYVLRKRRLGAARDTVPTGVVKNYLNELIVEAEHLRAQLFGLVGSGAAAGAGASAGGALRAAALAASGSGAADPALLQKLAALEASMNEQVAKLQMVTGEKEKLEKELAALRAAAANAGAAPAGDAAAGAEVAAMKEKLQGLEARLAEYSIIEDDLANLKRLQQENAALRAKLGIGAGATVAVPAAAAPAAPPAAEAAPDDNPLAELAAADQAAQVPAPAVVEPAAAAAAPAPEAPAPAAPADNFEKLVDQVEQSLQPPAAAAAAAAPAAEAAPAPAASSTEAGAGATLDKSDADLVAEFEKMLNA